MSNSTAINIVLNPVIDIAKFNQLVNSMKSAFTDLNPIDGKKLTATCIPHARGDEPINIAIPSLSFEYSPRTWG